MARPLGWTALAIALFVGAGGAVVVDRVFWDNELKEQLAEKDALLAELNADRDAMRQGMETLQTTNTHMRTLIDEAWKDTAEVARSHSSALEKLRAVIARLEALQKSLEEGGRP